MADEGETAKRGAEDPAGDNRDALRSWSDSTGSYHVEARFRGVKDGKASLEGPTAR